MCLLTTTTVFVTVCCGCCRFSMLVVFIVIQFLPNKGQKKAQTTEERWMEKINDDIKIRGKGIFSYSRLNERERDGESKKRANTKHINFIKSSRAMCGNVWWQWWRCDFLASWITQIENCIWSFHIFKHFIWLVQAGRIKSNGNHTIKKRKREATHNKTDLDAIETRRVEETGQDIKKKYMKNNADFYAIVNTLSLADYMIGIQLLDIFCLCVCVCMLCHRLYHK